jgi:hypothetical protein
MPEESMANAKVQTKTIRDHQLNANFQKPSASSNKRPLYPDYYRGPGPTTELISVMDDLDINRDRSAQRGHNQRKRRHRGKAYHLLQAECAQYGVASAHDSSEDDDGYDRRPQRRRYEQPIAARLRRELLVLGENVSLFVAKIIWLVRANHVLLAPKLRR